MASAVAPTIKAHSNTVLAAAGTSHTLPLTALGPQSGDLLIAHITILDGSRTITWPAGWTALWNSTATIKTEARYRVSDGTETDATITTSGNSESVVRTQRIDGFAGTPEAGTAATGTSAAPNPPSVTPSWGADNITLILAYAGFDDDGTGSLATAYPTGYHFMQVSQRSSAGIFAGDAIAVRVETAASFNPGTFTISTAASTHWIANTVVVKGAGAGHPWIDQVASNLEASGTTSHDVVIPAGLAAGDLLVLLADVSRSSESTATEPTGWTPVVNATQGTAGANGNLCLLATKLATGSETNTTFSTSASVRSANICFTIRSSIGSVVGSASATGNSTTPDPPSLDIGSTIDSMWLAVYAEDANNSVSVIPTGYMYATGMAAGDAEASVRVAVKYDSASTENPGTFTKGGSAGWIAVTAAVAALSTGWGKRLGLHRFRRVVPA